MAHQKRKNERNGKDTLPLIKFTGKIYLQTDFEGCAMICEEIMTRIDKCPESTVPIGFDLEWPLPFHGINSKTALAQLCISTRTCHLFHIYNIGKLPAAFTLLLSHPKVKLVGVNITADIWKLGRDFSGFPAQQIVKNNCLDCGKLQNQYFNTTERWSLAKLAAYLLKGQVDKSDKVRKGKWHVLPLNEAQRIYAATDAYVSLLTYLHIEKNAVDHST